ncbi:pentapeptide repeat-containing protein [Methylorubrum aminovorans]
MASTVALEILAREDYDEWHAFKKSTEWPIDLKYCKISNSTLSYFDFSGCDFDGAYFDDCDFRNANFSHIFARNATFRKCMLSDANFYRASLKSASFDRCEIDSTDFSRSYDLTYDAISTSYYDNNTQTPFDLADPDSWLDQEDDEEELDETHSSPAIVVSNEGEKASIAASLYLIYRREL